MENSSPPPTAVASDLCHSFHADETMHLAYERVVPRLGAVRSEPLEPLNLSVAVVVPAVLGAIPAIVEHRGALEQLITFDVADVDQLKEYTLALGHAFSVRRAAPDEVNDVPALARSQRAAREQLQADARTLARRGVFDSDVLRRLRGRKAHRIVAFDVLSLVELFLQHWDAVQGKTALTLAELDEARRGANLLLAALGRQAEADPNAEQSELIYRELYSRVVRTYAEVRSALRFLRRKQGDAERIAPSIFPRSKGR